MLFNRQIKTVVLEAKKKITIKPDKDASDYAANADTDNAPDTTDTEDDVAPDTTDTGDETTDYTDEGDNTDEEDSTGDTGGDSDTPEDASPAIPTTDMKKNSALLKDFIALYKLIESTIDRLADVKKGDLLVSSIIVQIMKNLSTTEKQIFNYIHQSFSNNSYVSNLYQYNYFIEALKINMEMMKKIKNLNKV
jgi:hypothetical protein